MKKQLENAKAYVALAATIATALLPNLAPNSTIHVIATAVLAVAGAIGVYATPNAEDDLPY